MEDDIEIDGWRRGKARQRLAALVERSVDLRVELANLELELELLRLGYSELFGDEVM